MPVSWSFTYVTTAQTGSFVNKAVVTVVDAAGQTTASDIAQYTGVGAQLSVETDVNAPTPGTPTSSDNAETSPGKVLTIGTALVYTDLVTNTGLVALKNVSLSNTYNGTTTFTALPVNGAACGSTFNVGDVNCNGQLDPNETWQYTSVGAFSQNALSGIHNATSTASAIAVVGTGTASGGDAATYYDGATAGGIKVVKAINAANPATAPTAAEDANSSSSPVYVQVGSTITFTFAVSSPNNLTIPGPIALTDVTVFPAGASGPITPTYVSGDKNGDGKIDKGEVWIYHYTPTAPAGHNGDVAAVTFTAGSTTSGSTDPAWYFGVNDAITIKKAVNAISPAAPTTIEEGDTTSAEQYLSVGSPITWTYRVGNSGNDPLSAITITDSTGSFSPAQITVATCGGHAGTFNAGDANCNGMLDPAETWLYTAPGGNALAGQQTTLGSVQATDLHFSTATVNATDAADYFGYVDQLTVVKAVNAVNPLAPTVVEDANYAPGPILSAGSIVTWSYLVTNVNQPGALPMDVLSIQDDNGTLQYNRGPLFDVNAVYDMTTGNVVGDTNGNGLLDPGETWLFQAKGTVPLGQYENTVTAMAHIMGAPSNTGDLMATDVTYLVPAPQPGALGCRSSPTRCTCSPTAALAAEGRRHRHLHLQGHQHRPRLVADGVDRRQRRRATATLTAHVHGRPTPTATGCSTTARRGLRRRRRCRMGRPTTRFGLSSTRPALGIARHRVGRRHEPGSA